MRLVSSFFHTDVGILNGYLRSHCHNYFIRTIVKSTTLLHRYGVCLFLASILFLRVGNSYTRPTNFAASRWILCIMNLPLCYLEIRDVPSASYRWKEREDVCDGSISKYRLAISIILIVRIFRIVRGVSIIAIDKLYKPQIMFAKLSFVIFEEAKHRESMG